MNILLDTCTFLWLVSGNKKLSEKTVELFQNPSNNIFLSVISNWEITVKYQLGKLPLPQPPKTYIPMQREKHGIAALPLDEQAIGHLAVLPALHKDPFDRMLICQAIQEGAVLMTPDPVIHSYPVKTVW